MTSIFRLDCIRVYDTDEHLYRDVSYSILGYYSTLDKALVAMRLNNKEAFDIECIYAYLIKELAIDGAIGTTDWLSVRSYDQQGKPVDECLQDYNLANQFEGRKTENIRFKIGDIVEVLEGRRLYTAIVAAVPPTPEDHFPILDVRDDCYMVLPLDAGPIDHLHIAPTHTFSLRHPLEEVCTDYLNTRLLILQGRQDEANMRSICVIEGHQYLYNFATLPSKSICRRCHQKWLADYSGDLINSDVWKEVDTFEGDSRSDEEIITAWSGHEALFL